MSKSREGVLLVIACMVMMVTGGCACDEQIVVTNRTEESLVVYLALPWPSYQIASDACQFAIVIGTHEEWSTSTARAAEKQAIGLRQPNGAMLFRVRRGSDDQWALFVLDSREPLDAIDPVHVFVDLDDSKHLHVIATDHEGKAVVVKNGDDEFWFGR